VRRPPPACPPFKQVSQAAPDGSGTLAGQPPAEPSKEPTVQITIEAAAPATRWPAAVAGGSKAAKRRKFGG
jgi:hypothetical protein